MPHPYVTIAFLLALIGSFFVGADWKGDQVQALWDAEKAAAAAAATKAAAVTQGGVDRAAINAGAETATIVEKIVEKTVYITKEIPTYVPDTSSCITLGLVRVLDAAASGVDPSTIDLAPGKFNETCADFGSRWLAQSIVGNYGKARANAADLTGLQKYVCNLRFELRPDAPAVDYCDQK